MIKQNRFVSSLAISGIVLAVTSCGSPPSQQVYPPSTPIPPAKLYEASTVAGGWNPSLTLNGALSNPIKGVTLTRKQTLVQSGPLVRLSDAWGGKEISVLLGHFDASDFGVNGSLTLEASVTDYPRPGGAYAVLTSLVVGGREYVNMKSQCQTQALWNCSSGVCSQSGSCAPSQSGTRSSFFSRDDWEQHQFPSFGYATTNSFPRCDAVNGWQCPLGLNALPTGDYTAKYVLMSNWGGSVGGLSATLNLTPIVKQDSVSRNTPPSNGGINLNVILVGSKNIADSHTDFGAQNLDLLFAETDQILRQNAGIGISQIKAYEWNDRDGGDYYSQVPLSKVGDMLESGSKAVDSGDEGNFINVFLVRGITQSQDKNRIVLGVSGGILGPAVNGLQTSGLVFSTYLGAGSLAAYNQSSCTVGNCTRNQQDSAFLEMGATVAHELGHYLGLNHPSEDADSSSFQTHDQLNDTPTCGPRLITNTGGAVTGSSLDQLSCYSENVQQPSPLGVTSCQTACDAAIGTGKYYNSADPTKASPLYPDNVCPAVQECQFNHAMWYTTKNRIRRSGAWIEDGSQFSPQSKAILQWSAFVK